MSFWSEELTLIRDNKTEWKKCDDVTYTHGLRTQIHCFARSERPLTQQGLEVLKGSRMNCPLMLCTLAK